MLVSIDWLKAMLPGLDAPPDAISDRLTAAGLEVEGLTRLSDALRGVAVAEVVALERHPKADKLQIATVETGAGRLRVVCGAPNVAVGQKVPFAPLGVTLPNGLTLEPREIRGVTSEGMLCAEDELGLSGDHEGLLVLDPAAPVGASVAEVLGRTDVILEIGVTPNRPDALSHFGVARELAALLSLPPPELPPGPVEADERAEKRARVRIEDRDGCALYAARIVTGVRVGPSPRWVQDRLTSLGLRPISNVVDATNLVLLELGQPLHAFDLDRLSGSEIRVRSAGSDERIRLLDGSQKVLDEGDLVIADAERPVALAGVMGGADSEVGSASTAVLLESAWFLPPRVRRSAKRHGLHTEASHRFERGADLGMVERALDRCAALVAEWAGGVVLSGRLVETGTTVARSPVPIRPQRAALLLGRPVTAAEVESSLRRLGLGAAAPAEPNPAGALWFSPPSWRTDLSIEADLIEEVGRLAGYDGLPDAPMAAASSPGLEGDAEAEVRAALVAEGGLETISLAFCAPGRAEAFAEDPAVQVANPLGEESRLLRPSLLPALLEAARHNQDQLPSVTDLFLFEIGRSFGWGVPGPLPVEKNRVAVLLRGRRHPAGWSSGAELVDAYDLKGALEGLFDHFRVCPRYEAAERPCFHPRSSTRLALAGQTLGWLGELHPALAQTIGLDGPPVFVAELSVDLLAAKRGSRPNHRPLPRHPPAERDLSFFLDASVEAAAVFEAVARAAPPELEAVRVFDVYEGPGVPEGDKSLALSLTFRAVDRTLSGAEVDRAQAEIVAEIQSAVGARLRSGT